MSRFSAVRENCVVRCPYPDADMALYAPMGCGYQTGAGTILNVLKPKPDQTVAVFGAGSVGFAAIMAAASIPARQIIAIDIVEQKLVLAKELGATHTIDSSKLVQGGHGDGGGVVEAIQSVTGGQGVDFAVDTTGVAAVIEKMLDCLSFGGTAASVGAPPREANITVNAGAFFAGMKKWVAVSEGDSHPPEVSDK
jgi:Zn-dependent alcohol dehydrogenase